jgi:hypothetical protein
MYGRVQQKIQRAHAQNTREYRIDDVNPIIQLYSALGLTTLVRDKQIGVLFPQIPRNRIGF